MLKNPSSTIVIPYLPSPQYTSESLVIFFSLKSQFLKTSNYLMMLYLLSASLGFKPLYL